MARDDNELLRWGDIRDALMEYHQEQRVAKYATSGEYKAARFGIEGAMYAIEDNVDAVDAVGIVRCQDCKFSRALSGKYEKSIYRENIRICENPDASERGYNAVFPNHFCSYGAKRPATPKKETAKTYEAIEDILTEKICNAHYTDIEDFLGYPISADVLENLRDRVREALDRMTEDEMLLLEQKYLNETNCETED